MASLEGRGWHEGVGRVALGSGRERNVRTRLALEILMVMRPPVGQASAGAFTVGCDSCCDSYCNGSPSRACAADPSRPPSRHVHFKGRGFGSRNTYAPRV